MLILQCPGQKLNGFFEVGEPRQARNIAPHLTQPEGGAALDRASPQTTMFITSARERAPKDGHRSRSS